VLTGFILLVVIVALLGFLLRKNVDRTVGRGMGLNNNEHWGMTEHDKEYHE